MIPAKSFEIKKGVVAVKGISLSQEDEFLLMELNSKFEKTLLFTPNKEEGVLEIRSTSLNHNAVHIAVELEDLGVPWKNPQNLGFQVHPLSIASADRFSRARA